MELKKVSTKELVAHLKERFAEQDGINEVPTEHLYTLCECCEMEILNRMAYTWQDTVPDAVWV